MKVSQVNVRKSKMLLVMPLLVIPFLTLAFYALGGGREKKEKAVDSNGLNMHLPGANLKEEKLMDKLGFYDKAAKDSAKMAELMRSDPYYKGQLPVPATGELEQLTENTASKHNQRLNVSPYEITKNKPEDLVIQKLSMLQKELDKHSSSSEILSKDPGHPYSRPELSGDVDRLESLMNSMSSSQDEDQEIKQLSSVMDKILDVQHPARVKERMKEKAMQKTSPAMTVSVTPGNDSTESGFFGLDHSSASKYSNAIEAVVNENQLLVSGGVIKLRLLQDVYVDDQQIPAGTFVFGTVGLNGERLEIEINSIRSGNSLFPVKMEVHDMDGLPGIHIPGAISRDVAKQSTDNSLQMMELNSLDPSMKAQATAAGINTAKLLFSKKVKLVRVMVKAGYKVLIKIKNNS